MRYHASGGRFHRFIRWLAGDLADIAVGTGIKYSLIREPFAEEAVGGDHSVEHSGASYLAGRMAP